MEFKILKEELLKNLEFKIEYLESDDMVFLLSEMVKDARIKSGLTQEQLAKKLKTKQSSIARLEAGKFLPTLSFLQRIAKSLGIVLVPPKFVSVDTETRTQNANPVFNSEWAERERMINVKFQNLETSTV